MTPQLYIFLKKLQGFVEHHHPIMFFMMVTLLLSVAVFSLYQILTTSLADEGETTSTIGVFDKKTIDRIKDLQTSGNSDDAPLVFPSPRADPFGE